MPVNTCLSKKKRHFKISEESVSVTQLITHLGVHECIDHIHREREMPNI